MSEKTLFDTLKEKLLNNKPVAFLLVASFGIQQGLDLLDRTHDLWSIFSWEAGSPEHATPENPSVGNPIETHNFTSHSVVEDMLRPVYFEELKSVLDEKGFEQVKKYAKLLKDQKYQSIEIAGHTSAHQPSDNQILGEKRVSMVSQILINEGIPRTKIVPIAFGAEKSKEAPAPGYADRVDFKIGWD